MYAHSYGQPSPQPALSNNPFVEDPSTAHARFPDLSASTAYSNQPQQYLQHPSQSYAAGGPYSQPMALQSQFTSASYAPQYPTQAHMAAFQPSTGFPQQQQQQYPILHGYPLTYSNAPYALPIQTNATATPSHLSEFDPYAQAQAQVQALQTASHIVPGASGGGGGTGPPGVSHPRDLIRTYKSGLEAWDAYSWKQLFNACDVLKEAWAARMRQAEGIVQQYGGHAEPGLFGSDPAFGYASQVEGWKQVLKDANDNFDTIAASTFQLHEVFNSYRQSGDQASKRRVRESCNAAVKGLPDWPSN